MAINYYRKSTSSSRGPYYSSTSSTTEIDMRKETINFMDGHFPEIAKAKPILLRKVRLDSNNNIIYCNCLDPVSKEADKSTFCLSCWGLGMLFDEEWIDTYATLETSSDSTNAFLNTIIPPGIISFPSIVFYTKYNDKLTTNDRLVEVELNDDGTVKNPIVRINMFRINYVWGFRSDNGKLEYNKIFTHKEEVKYLNKQSYSGRR